MRTFLYVLLFILLIIWQGKNPIEFKDLDRQGQAKSIIITESNKLSSPIQSIKSSYAYAKKPPYVEWLFSAPETYENFRKYYMKKASENDWQLVKEERQGEGGKMLFYKQLPEEKGACELLFNYDAENKQFVCRITWLEKNSTK